MKVSVMFRRVYVQKNRSFSEKLTQVKELLQFFLIALIQHSTQTPHFQNS